jgi:hypothetical protein
VSLSILPRSAWGARPPKSVSRMSRSDGVSLHYPGTKLGASTALGDYTAVISFIKGVQNFHMDSNYLVVGGGSDVAYRFFVDYAGRVWEGRGWGVAGGDTKGANSTCHGIQLILNDGQEPSPAQVGATRALIREHDRRWGRGRIAGHRDWAGNPSGTTCPASVIARLIAADEFNPNRTISIPVQEEEVKRKPDSLIRLKSGAILRVNANDNSADHITHDIPFVKGLYFLAGEELVDNTADANAGQKLVDTGVIWVRPASRKP